MTCHILQHKIKKLHSMVAYSKTAAFNEQVFITDNQKSWNEKDLVINIPSSSYYTVFHSMVFHIVHPHCSNLSLNVLIPLPFYQSTPQITPMSSTSLCWCLHQHLGLANVQNRLASNLPLQPSTQPTFSFTTIFPTFYLWRWFLRKKTSTARIWFSRWDFVENTKLCKFAPKR